MLLTGSPRFYIMPRPWCQKLHNDFCKSLWNFIWLCKVTVWRSLRWSSDSGSWKIHVLWILGENHLRMGFVNFGRFAIDRLALHVLFCSVVAAAVAWFVPEDSSLINTAIDLQLSNWRLWAQGCEIISQLNLEACMRLFQINLYFSHKKTYNASGILNC